MFDFTHSASLEYVDYSNNHIDRFENVGTNKYLKVLILDHNRISKIEGLGDNKSLIWLSLAHNELTYISNLDGLML